MDKLQDALIDTENKKRLLGEVLDFETVKDCVEMEVNSAINLY